MRSLLREMLRKIKMKSRLHGNTLNTHQNQSNAWMHSYRHERVATGANTCVLQAEKLLTDLGQNDPKKAKVSRHTIAKDSNSQNRDKKSV